MQQQSEMTCYEQQADMIQPSDTDILCGRGKAYSNHPGNRKFKKIIESNLPKYKNAARRIERSIVLAAVVDEVIDTGSRFLRKDKDTGVWSQLDTDQCHEKVGHALRDLIRKIPKRSFASIETKKKKNQQRRGYPEQKNHTFYDNSNQALKNPLDSMPIWDTNAVVATRNNEQQEQRNDNHQPKNNALHPNVGVTMINPLDSIWDEKTVFSIGTIQKKDQESKIHHKNNFAWDTNTNKTNQFNNQHSNNYQQTKETLEKRLNITMNDLLAAWSSNAKTPVVDQQQPLDLQNNHTRSRKRTMDPSIWDPIPREIIVPDISPEKIQNHEHKQERRMSEISLIQSILDDGKDNLVPESTSSFPKQNWQRNCFGGFHDVFEERPDLTKEESLSDFRF